jgi:hypothetical protein
MRDSFLGDYLFDVGVWIQLSVPTERARREVVDIDACGEE